MRQLRRLWMRLRATIGSGHFDRDFSDELESILQMHVDDNLSRGQRKSFLTHSCIRSRHQTATISSVECGPVTPRLTRNGGSTSDLCAPRAKREQCTPQWKTAVMSQ